MKFALYSDYFQGIPPYGGGGEVYAIRLAEGLVKDGHKVTLFTNKIDDTNVNIFDVFTYYGIDKSIQNAIKFDYAPTIGAYYKTRKRNEKKAHNYLKKWLSDYDFFINCSESTMHGFTESLNLKSYKIVHFPWGLLLDNRLVNLRNKIFNKADYDRTYQMSYNLFLPNSKFTESWVKKMWYVENTRVLYPPIAFDPVELPINKKNYILYTGRVIKEKMCLEFARCFKKIYRKFPDWTFVIVGNYNRCDAKYMARVEKMLRGTNYQMHLDAPQNQLIQLYKDSSIFWSGKGYGTNNPINMEHFGMTTVEAMANGCVPVVINKAGQAEIVNNECGFKWDNFNELVCCTENLISDKNLLNYKAVKSVEQSKQYLMPQFMKNFYKCINLYDKS